MSTYVYGKATPTRQTLEELARARQAVAALQQSHAALTEANAKLARDLAKAKARRNTVPTALRKRRTKLAAPIYGGPTGLMAATKESLDLDRRTEHMIAAGQDSEWIREYKRIRNIK